MGSPLLEVRTPSGATETVVSEGQSDFLEEEAPRSRRARLDRRDTVAFDEDSPSERLRASLMATQPKIRMETLSSFGTRCVLFSAYLIFAMALVGGLTYQSRGLRTERLEAGVCDMEPGMLPAIDDLLGDDREFACTYNDTTGGGSSWVALVFGLDTLQGSVDIVAVFPNATAENATGVLDPAGNFVAEGTPVTFNVRIEACRAGDEPCYKADGGDWYQVLDRSYTETLSRVTAADRWWDGIVSDEDDEDEISEFQVTLVDIYQNQPAIGNTGALQGYRVLISYTDDAGLLGPDTQGAYEFKYFSARRGPLSLAVLTIMFVLCIIVVIAWVLMQRQYEPDVNKWLRERKWLVVLITALLLYLNPIFVVVQFMGRVSLATTMAVETFSHLGYSLALFVFLLLCDGLRPVTYSFWCFYLPKVVVVVCILFAGLAITIWSLPSLYGEESESFLAIQGWSRDRKEGYVGVILAYFALSIVWLGLVVGYSIHTLRVNNRVPYLHNRYQQLSFRFFVSLGYFVIAVFAVSDLYIFVDVVSRAANDNDWTLDEVADQLNELLRNQGVNLPSVTFLTAYVFALLYLYLPPSTKKTGFNALYFRTRSEARLVKYGVHIPQLNQKRAPFCVETALMMLEMSWQAYYDPEEAEDQENVSIEEAKDNIMEGRSVERSPDEMPLEEEEKEAEAVEDAEALAEADAAAKAEEAAGADDAAGTGILEVEEPEEMPEPVEYINVEQHGFELVTVCVEPTTDTHAMICVHKKEKLIVVAFRGSSSRTHWLTNLDFQQMNLDLAELEPPKMEAEASSILDGDATGRESAGFWDRVRNTAFGDVTTGGDPTPMSQTKKSSPLPPVGDEEIALSFEPDLDAAYLAPEGGSMRTRGGEETQRATQMVEEQEEAEGGGFVNFFTELPGAVTSGVGAAAQGVATAATTALRGVGAIAHRVTPNFIRGWVHRGFWNAYAVVRPQVHAAIRREVRQRRWEEFELFCTGHSLGGALASLAAADLAINLRIEWSTGTGDDSSMDSTPPQTPIRNLSALLFGSSPRGGGRRGGDGESDDGSDVSSIAENGPPPLKRRGPQRNLFRMRNFRLGNIFGSRRDGDGLSARVSISCYTFGQPRVGNRAWAATFNEAVTNTYRVAVDGDLVSNVPRSTYTCLAWKHVGTPVVIDKEGRGSLLVDPSFIERKFRTRSRRSVASHSLQSYRRGLAGVFYGPIEDPEREMQTSIGMWDAGRMRAPGDGDPEEDAAAEEAAGGPRLPWDLDL